MYNVPYRKHINEMAALVMAAYTWVKGCRDRVLCKYTTYTVHHLYDEW